MKRVRHCFRCQKSFAQFHSEYSNICGRCHRQSDKAFARAFVTVATHMIEQGEGNKVVAFLSGVES